MNYKVDIFKILKDISYNRMSAIDKLSDEELKSVSPYVIQMWVKGADNNMNVRMPLTNDYVNQFIFTLSDHPRLLLKLLCCANGFEIDTRFKFNKKKKRKSMNFVIQTVMKYYGHNETHATDILPLLFNDDILSIGEDLGYEKDDMKKLKNEIKTI